MTEDLFGGPPGEAERIGAGSALLRGFALPSAADLVAAVDAVISAAPFRRMSTPGGQAMSVTMSNAGALGWITDRRGYRYSPVDPQSGRPWPPLPGCVLSLGRAAAALAGYEDFVPDACLINRYEPGSRMSLHQDRDEKDFDAPIVSISLGLPAVFLFGGLSRSERTARVTLAHGDVLVWGGPDRLRFHGVMPLGAGEHPVTGACRINLTLRKAG
ncbi:DNA oxidative demethylase AlkB [Paludibacterium paludis]|uniref:Alpha-ketoglutarate-dependent dioxygenase AlkB n=1 Tax=Paludibacterium paludis TaxID=1225769 RepID=A0A918UAR9_9NEIS|nr:DNA oxidative demethylase AlkB [Paludibacterium paludis]GGY24227.1 alpha-ketoglutarate-dependent dioxygenase AlkB [Paludibacterium paludis]